MECCPKLEIYIIFKNGKLKQIVVLPSFVIHTTIINVLD